MGWGDLNYCRIVRVPKAVRTLKLKHEVWIQYNFRELHRLAFKSFWLPKNPYHPLEKESLLLNNT